MGNHVSVVIPSYNRVELIRETLDSLKRENHPGVELEVIVVDDGSTDGSDLFTKENYPWVKLKKQSRKGAPTARNNGLSLATGKYVLFLDSDDLVEKGFFLDKVGVLDVRADVSGVYGPWDYFDSGTGDIIPRFEPYPIINQPDKEGHLQRLLGGWYIPCNAILWEKEFLLSIGGQNEGLLINQDVDLNFRALLEGDIIGIEAPKALVRDHDGQRVGTIVDCDRLEAILKLRQFFLEQLGQYNLLTKVNKEALGRYLFNFWVTHRSKCPLLAKQYLEMSKSLYPELRLDGGPALKFLDFIFGPVYATKIKSILGPLR